MADFQLDTTGTVACAACNGRGYIPIDAEGAAHDCKACIGKRFNHNGRVWRVVYVAGHYFAKDDRDNLTGPYSTVEEAEAWVWAIAP